jgi:glycosyltransferase involved in cell wall biosynthesis
LAKVFDLTITSMVYNVERYLHQCIDSIMQQTKQNFELILVNDGSKDKSGEICEEYRSKYPDQITVIHQENRGLLLTRRTAIARARGDFVIFVDSDDYLRGDALEVIEQAINRYEADLVLYKYDRVTDEGRVTESKADFFHGEVFTKDNKKRVYERIMEGALNSLCIKAVKLNLIDVERDYSVMSHVSDGEALLQSLPMLTYAERIVYLDEALYFYRYNTASIMHTFNPGKVESIITVESQLMQYMVKWGMDDAHGWELLYNHRLQLIQAVIWQIVLATELSDGERMRYLHELSGEPFFVEAYDGATDPVLKPVWRLVMLLMRKGRIKTINMLIKAYQALPYRKTKK